jgi:hypothetical protein
LSGKEVSEVLRFRADTQQPFADSHREEHRPRRGDVADTDSIDESAGQNLRKPSRRQLVQHNPAAAGLWFQTEVKT